ncbi:putative fumarylacetoacetate hydrolase [Vibrio nigripulchritudo SFn27]|nr:putative fumarylacetoacetate hydrolase [Vibrio nigripulchritudo BLFn1]CCN88494.1 putative fumarylacetoacetate hydrolase [Vibrio nigripulchritudo SFn27]CCN95901.1 putative fumarylacetoacetate hydrolase [Vibrio nigripulchritudo ENn2]CCO39210.1 putative fumarylacetoacetate hydrolase [Vibrio nigripulchritudo SFn135]CCO50824.1 putative fumarylacetoacetate hydrolase [Vibrio nigripulchritudo Wn13]
MRHVMRVIQFTQNNTLKAAVVESIDQVRVINTTGGTYELAMEAIESGKPLAAVIDARLSDETLSYQSLVDSQALLPPITHEDPSRWLVTGTGLTHLGSADARAEMHAKLSGDEELSDSMKMFQLGVEGGKPNAGETGAQPEWFYKGDGQCVVAPEKPITMPDFAKDGGEEPELTALYVIGNDGQPYRIGFAIGNEFSDHVTEHFNYLWLAHSKLRSCSYGPELLIGDLPENLEGISTIHRNGERLWSKTFLTGEANMAHTIANLEHHHFKYEQFRRPGDLHVHYMGTATLSFADKVQTQVGDQFEISIPAFGRSLRNTLAKAPEQSITVKAL